MAAVGPFLLAGVRYRSDYISEFRYLLYPETKNGMQHLCRIPLLISIFTTTGPTCAKYKTTVVVLLQSNGDFRSILAVCQVCHPARRINELKARSARASSTSSLSLSTAGRSCRVMTMWSGVRWVVWRITPDGVISVIQRCGCRSIGVFTVSVLFSYQQASCLPVDKSIIAGFSVQFHSATLFWSKLNPIANFF